MSLAPGARLGAYEILRLIGAGGMGEVYQARDTRLDRLVALKVLPEKLASDDARRQRFEREARAVAALNHPHICDLHDVGAHGQVDFLVMEYVEGQTLADRLVRGPLPAADVLRYAVELADALDHAHRRGLVHRDLKPGNVMLTKSGAKLLDFGLSKLQSTPDLTGLSTVVSGSAPLTAQGAVLGTYPYMAPEQLEGRETDARTDIFAFGALVYEMATGQRAFQGAAAASLIGAILHTDPAPISTLQPLAPPGLDHVVSRCLAKNPEDRWQTARDLVLELRWVASNPASVPVMQPQRDRRAALWSMASLAVLAAAAGVAIALYFRSPADETVARLTFTPSPGLTLAEVRNGGPVTISPDGLRVVYVAVGSDGQQRLWVQALDAMSAQPLAGTEGAAYPFWNPDSRAIGFFANQRLKRINVDGGPPLDLCDAVLPRGGTWNHAGVIVFSAEGGAHLYQVSSGGGVPAELTFERSNSESLWPSFLPDGRHFLYFGRFREPGIHVASLDQGEKTTLLAKGLYAGAAYASDGYVMLFKGGSMAGTLLAHELDPKRLALVGEPVALAERVPFYPNFGRADFSVSATGRLIHGTLGPDPTSLVWFDRAGNPIASVPGAVGFQKPVLSPDGTTIGAHRIDPDRQSQEVWLIDATRGDKERLTTNPGLDIMGLWSPDGRYILYGSTREDTGATTYLKGVRGSTTEVPLFPSSDERERQQMTDWSPDGKHIVFGSRGQKTLWDVWTMPAPQLPGGEAGAPALYLRTQFNEHDGVLSPDGRWMAYSSDQSGRLEVYVDAFPTRGAGFIPISTSGGRWPQWRRDERELFYLASDHTLMAVPVQTNGGFTAGAPRGLFKLQMKEGGARNEITYAPASDGQRFLVNVTREAAAPPISVFLNWPAALRR
ncbi:MAG TPA: protein kinase [Vicinamibacterales bacterium]|nr:protein kinase [Vicinamibacterales bacterium]